MNASNDSMLFALNFCLLFAKYFIHNCKQQGEEVNIITYKEQLKRRLMFERYILESQDKHEIYANIWAPVAESLN